NPDIAGSGEVVIPRGTLHYFRTKFLWQGTCYERLRIKNYGLIPVEVSLDLLFEADFVDIFEVRGTRSAQRGQLQRGMVKDGNVILSYRGLDDVVRCTRLAFTPAPKMLSAGQARFLFTLQPTQEESLYVSIACEAENTNSLLPFDQ